MSTRSPTAGYLEAFGRRVVQDALTDATAGQWEARAATFEAAAHRPGIDWTGHATAEQLDTQRRRCLLTALACRRHARLLRSAGP